MCAALRRNDPIAPQLFAELRQSIIEMRLKPGEALSEKDIALRYGVSRQPVREAFIKLSEAGLVDIRPSRGTYVRKISVRDVANARFVREAVECSLARYAARLASPQDCARLRALIVEQEAAAEANDYVRFNTLDEAFHAAIGDIVQCDYAVRIVEGARIQNDRVRFLSLAEASPMPLLIAQHKEITAGLEAGDAERAEAAMRRHLREILVALPRIARAHPDLFDDQDLPAYTVGLTPV